MLKAVKLNEGDMERIKPNTAAHIESFINVELMTRLKVLMLQIIGKFIGN